MALGVTSGSGGAVQNAKPKPTISSFTKTSTSSSSSSSKKKNKTSDISGSGSPIPTTQTTTATPAATTTTTNTKAVAETTVKDSSGKTAADYSNDWNAAKAAGASQAELDAIHQKAEAVRAQSGYSGGADGSQYVDIKQNEASTTTNKTDSDIEKAVASVTGKDSAIESSVSKLTDTSAKTGTPTTVYHADGTTSAAHIIDGRTHLDDGSTLKNGDIVHTNGGTYLVKADGSSEKVGISTQGIDKSNTSDMYVAYVPGVGMQAANPAMFDSILQKGGYILGGAEGAKTETFNEQNGTASAITNWGDVLRNNGYASNGSYAYYTNENAGNSQPGSYTPVKQNDTSILNYTPENGNYDTSKEPAVVSQPATAQPEQPTTETPANEPNVPEQSVEDFKETVTQYPSVIVSEDGSIDFSNMTTEEAASAIMNLVQNGTVDLDKFMTWAEAYAMAYETLGAGYDADIEKALNALQANALSSGFYGQIPYETVRANALASAEVDKMRAIADYAKELKQYDSDTAIEKFNALLSQNQITQQNLIEMLELMYSMEADEADRKYKYDALGMEQEQFNKQMEAAAADRQYKYDALAQDQAQFDAQQEAQRAKEQTYTNDTAFYSAVKTFADEADRQAFITKYYADYGYRSAAEAYDAYMKEAAVDKLANPTPAATNTTTTPQTYSSRAYNGMGLTVGQVIQLQQEYNNRHPNNKIEVDGSYGPESKAAFGTDALTAYRQYFTNNTENVLGLDNSAASTQNAESIRREVLNRIFKTTQGNSTQRSAATQELKSYIEGIYPQLSPDMQKEIEGLLTLNGYSFR